MRSSICKAGIVGIFTGVLAVVGFLQTWAFVQSERSFLTIQNIAFDGQRPVAIKPIIIWYFMKNSGRSPGIIEDEVFNVATNLPATPSYVGHTDFTSPPMIPDNEERGAFAPKMPNGLSAALDVPTLRGIETGTLRFYFFGYIKYSDSFWLFGNRKTGFCFVYLPNGVPGVYTFSPCQNWGYTYAY